MERWGMRMLKGDPPGRSHASQRHGPGRIRLGVSPCDDWPRLMIKGGAPYAAPRPRSSTAGAPRMPFDKPNPRIHATFCAANAQLTCEPGLPLATGARIL